MNRYSWHGFLDRVSYLIVFLIDLTTLKGCKLAMLVGQKSEGWLAIVYPSRGR
jgi:hypothetical protein